MDIKDCWYKNVCTNTCRQGCVRFNCMKDLCEKANLPESMWANKNLLCGPQDLAAFNKLTAIKSNISDFVNSGNNLYIYSHTCGNGKTSWSIKLLIAYFNSIWHKSGLKCHGLFVHVPTLLYTCKKSISQHVEGFDELCNLLDSVEIVVWDDLPCSTFTGYEHQIILQYIDNRINAGLSNIFTGNCNQEECVPLIGDRLTSRVFGCSEIIEFVEPDKRGLNNG